MAGTSQGQHAWIWSQDLSTRFVLQSMEGFSVQITAYAVSSMQERSFDPRAQLKGLTFRESGFSNLKRLITINFPVNGSVPQPFRCFIIDYPICLPFVSHRTSEKQYLRDLRIPNFLRSKLSFRGCCNYMSTKIHHLSERNNKLTEG